MLKNRLMFLHKHKKTKKKNQRASSKKLCFITDSWLISHVMHAQIFHQTTLFNGKILPHSWKSHNKKKTQSSFTRTYHKTVISSSRGHRSTLRIARRWQLFSLRIFSHVFPRPRSKFAFWWFTVVDLGWPFIFLKWCIFFCLFWVSIF